MSIGLKIFKWYQKNKRSLPWRGKTDPYHIWLSEIMLQQTTVQTVIPYYKKFLKKFPTLKSLAQSPLKAVLPYWAGLGYYSRVKNLHQSARLFWKENKGRLPESALELSVYPGFGPYTSKAVSSIAFNERVFVLDGNVIRLLCRHEGFKAPWWKAGPRQTLEKKAALWGRNLPPGDMNQALMELGATVCTPRSPLCGVCPIQKTCRAFKLNTVNILPLKRPVKKRQIWLWKPKIIFQNNQVCLTRRHPCPFLKEELLFPGTIKELKEKPKTWDIKHSITCYDIFIKPVLEKRPKKRLKNKDKALMNASQDNCQWIKLSEIEHFSPFSVMSKILSKTTPLLL